MRQRLGHRLVLAALVAGLCLPAGMLPGQSSIDIVDQLGRAVHLDRAPRRIVSLAPSNTELLFALGLGDRVAGVTGYCNYPPEARDKPQVGGFSNPDLEKIVVLAPDLVVAAPIHEKQVIPALEKRGFAVLGLKPGTVAGVLHTLDLLGEATGTKTAAAALQREIETRIDRVRALVAGLPGPGPGGRPGVFYLLWHEPLMTAGGDILQNELIGLAGGRNLFGDLKGYPEVDLESVLARQPDLIVVGVGHGVETVSPSLAWALGEPRLRATPARKAGRVVAIDADIMSRAGPRVADAAEQLLALIHPELFGGLEGEGRK